MPTPASKEKEKSERSVVAIMKGRNFVEICGSKEKSIFANNV
jgi:hypothetical protein